MAVGLILLFLCAAIQYGSAERFFIITKPNDSCPGKFTGEPCLTITQFVSGSYVRFLSDPTLVTEITLDLQPGLHTVTNSYDFQVNNMEIFVLQGTTAGTILDCGSGQFNVSHVKYVKISDVEFVNCRKKIVINTVSQLIFENSSLNEDEALVITNTKKAIVSKSLFRDSTNTVYVQNTSVTISESNFTNNCIGIFGKDSCITVRESTFMKNTANCIVESNGYVPTGGAVHLEQSTTLNQEKRHSQDTAMKIIDSTFTGNEASENGGAIYTSGVDITVNGSNFTNNTARLQGGAVYSASTRSDMESTIKIYGSEFTSNHASIGGGAIYAPGSVQVTSSAFISNTAHLRGGGAVYTGGRHSDIEVISSAFRNNSAAYCGAFDVDELHHTIKFSQSVFTLNTATGKSDISSILSFSGIKSDIGGVVCVRNASVVITACNFSQNMAAGFGGVMYVDDSAIEVEQSVFDGNMAGESGGVIFTELHGIELLISLTSFVNNQAQNGDGGVVYIGRANSQVRVSKSWFGFNSATNRGGVIVIYGGILDVNRSTFHNNTAVFGGEIGSACNSEVTIDNIVISKDPEFSFCYLYEENERSYVHSTTPLVTTTVSSSTVTTTNTNPPASSGPTTGTEATKTFTETNDITTAFVPPTSPSSMVFTTSSTPALYFELNGTIFFNNSVITLQDLGEGDNALACVTNNPKCCRTPPNRAGEYYYPNGVQVPIRIRADNLYRSRGNRKVYLNRKSGVVSPTGTFRCEIPDAAESVQILYIDLI